MRGGLIENGEVPEGMATNKAVHMARPGDISEQALITRRRRVMGLISNCHDKRLLEQVESVILRENDKQEER